MRKGLLYGIIISAIWAYLSLAASKSGEAPKFYPIDEATQDTSFSRFRERLIGAVRNQDYDFLLGVVAENVGINYDGPQGIETFKNQFGLSDPGSKYWKEFEIILSNGGSFEVARDGKRIFWAPYVNSKWHGNRIRHDLSKNYKWPDDVFEDMEFGVALGDSVLLRKEPRLDAPVIRVLSYDLVGAPDKVYGGRQARPKLFPGWIRIVTHDGCCGYIPREYYRDWFDYSLRFMQIDGRWKIVSFSRGIL